MSQVSRIQLGRATHTDWPCCIFKWVVWHISMSHVAQVQMRRCPKPLAMTHSYVCHDSFICATWLIPMSHRCKCEGVRNLSSPWSLAMPLVRTFSRTHTNPQTYTHTNSLSVRWSPWPLAVPLLCTFSLPLSHPHTYTLTCIHRDQQHS